MSNLDVVQREIQVRLGEEVEFFKPRAMELMKRVEEEGREITLQHNAEITSIPFTMTGHSWEEYQISGYHWVVTDDLVPDDLYRHEFETLPLALDHIDWLLRKD